MLSQQLWKILAVIVVAVILFFGVFLGLSSGKHKAQSQAIATNTESLQKALEFFYSDQNRYPTALEFANTAIMSQYMSSFPPANIVSKNCPETFTYKQQSVSSYQLRFCLPAAYGGAAAGWNSIVHNH